MDDIVIGSDPLSEITVRDSLIGLRARIRITLRLAEVAVRCRGINPMTLDFPTRNGLYPARPGYNLFKRMRGAIA